jgi:hypothetical protein
MHEFVPTIVGRHESAFMRVGGSLRLMLVAFSIAGNHARATLRIWNPAVFELFVVGGHTQGEA